jgi:phenylalanyl-tRNA synthetase beta chain
MLGLGNPLHAFDFRTLAGGEIVVRRAREGEKLRTLDGVVRDLDPSDLMIADAERAIALAGIMGGEETEIGEGTNDVLLEAANFEPTRLWRTSERLRLRTEGSNRWEKGVDPYLAEQAAIWATELLVELTAARWVGHTDAKDELPGRPVVRFDPKKASDYIGLEVAADEQRDILTRLGLEARDGEYVVPTWRARDLTREVDLIEEIARFKLDVVPFTLPVRREMTGSLTRTQRTRRRVEDALVALGLSEVYTPSLVEDDADPRALRLPEPITVELAVLRTELLPSLVEAGRRNVEVGNEGVALFEIARVYLPAGADELPAEQTHVAAIVEGDFLRVKGVVEALLRTLHAEATWSRAESPLLHPGKAARIEAGVVGELHPAELEGTWGVFELDLEALVLASHEPVAYEDVITYPAVRQDIAVAVAEDVEVGALVEATREASGPMLREVRVFDVYRGDQVGEGRKSVALHLSFQSPERTLTDEEAAELRGGIVAALADRFGAELRA